MINAEVMAYNSWWQQGQWQTWDGTDWEDWGGIDWQGHSYNDDATANDPDCLVLSREWGNGSL